MSETRFEGRGETGLGLAHLSGGEVALGGNGVEPLLVAQPLALGLVADVSGGDRVHQEDRRGDDRPADDECRARDGDGLGEGGKADEAGFRCRISETGAALAESVRAARSGGELVAVARFRPALSPVSTPTGHASRMHLISLTFDCRLSQQTWTI